MQIQEKYTPAPLATASTTTFEGAAAVGNFICITAGTITITKRDGTVVLNAFPAAAGSIYGLAMRLGHGFIVTLGTGASGTLGVTN